jgi:hypothetical protein
MPRGGKQPGAGRKHGSKDSYQRTRTGMIKVSVIPEDTSRPGTRVDVVTQVDARRRIMSLIERNPELCPVTVLLRLGGDESLPPAIRIAAAAAAWPAIYPKLSAAQIENTTTAPDQSALLKLRELMERSRATIDITPSVPALPEPPPETAEIVPLKRP